MMTKITGGSVGRDWLAGWIDGRKLIWWNLDFDWIGTHES